MLKELHLFEDCTNDLDAKVGAGLETPTHFIERPKTLPNEGNILYRLPPPTLQSKKNTSLQKPAATGERATQARRNKIMVFDIPKKRECFEWRSP
jgi:hypothetical protein